MAAMEVSKLCKSVVRPGGLNFVSFKNYRRLAGQVVPVASGKEEVTGKNLYWEKHGTGPHPVLCLPGHVGSISMNYHPVFKQADLKKFTFIGVDPQGFGKSRPPDRELQPNVFALQTDAERAAKVMESLGYKKYSMLGWSNGGISAALLAATYPQVVHRAVICNSTVRFDEQMQFIMKQMCDLNNWEAKDAKAILEVYDEKYFKKTMTEWVSWLTKHQDILSQQLLDPMKKVKIPMLYIHGAKDSIAKDIDIREIQKRIRTMRTKKVPEGRHSHLEFLDEFVTATEEFLGEEEFKA